MSIMDQQMQVQLEASLNSREECFAKIDKLEVENKILKEALGFYANYSPWGKGVSGDYNDTITILDCEECATDFNDGFIGGKHARQALKKIEELNKESE